MVQSAAATVEAYLAELPEDRRAVVSAARDLVLRHLPAGYQEAMGFGMICYNVPLSDYPDTYNKQPLCYAALAAQKRHYALYLTNVYGDSPEERRLREAFAARGLKLDMGKSCLRFKKLEDLALDAVGDVVASTPPAAFIARYEESRRK
ncbi:MAG: DUF1801 domain-containing protein [Gemmatirosa sp.]